MKRTALLLQTLSGILLVACSSSSGSGFGDGGLGPVTKPVIGADGGVVIPPVTGSDGGPVLHLGSDSGTPPPVMTTDGGACSYLASDPVDHDGDGWSSAQGDCNDCNKYVNPGAYDVPSNGIDEDCNGHADDEPTACDSTVGTSSPATTTGMEGAKAMDLCRQTAQAPAPAMKTWGVISADYVTPDGAPNSSSNFMLGLGLLGPKFGTSNSTQQGVRMLGLSSGTARQPTDPGYQDVSGFDKGYTTGAPTGFPGQTPACGNIQFGQPHDGAGIRVVLRVPTNAATMSFDSNLFSYEFPDYVCSTYNDTFVAIMTPAPMGEPASANNNIAFDSMGNVISVNAGFLVVCDQNSQAGGKNYPCAEGPGKLHGTGFGVDTTDNPNGDDQDHASTDWLRTTVTVSNLAGQEITLLFAIWDSSDGVLDSSILIDNFQWTFLTGPNDVPPVATGPVTTPPPK